MRLSIVYAVGNVVLTGASAADMFTVDVQKLVNDCNTHIILNVNISRIYYYSLIPSVT